MATDNMGEDVPQERDDTFFLPEDFPDTEELKTGDTITLRVVGRDSDGQLEVEHVPSSKPGAGEADWKDDLRQTMSSGGSMPPEEE